MSFLRPTLTKWRWKLSLESTSTSRMFMESWITRLSLPNLSCYTSSLVSLRERDMRMAWVFLAANLTCNLLPQARMSSS